MLQMGVTVNRVSREGSVSTGHLGDDLTAGDLNPAIESAVKTS